MKAVKQALGLRKEFFKDILRLLQTARSMSAYAGEEDLLTAIDMARGEAAKAANRSYSQMDKYEQIGIGKIAGAIAGTRKKPRRR
ncbi:hypothetical protein [Tianweitania sp.]|uniref:hypothetical protein n=1 Tax=Tianweitania sp. TaxID=2021634 RepID=UPI0028A215DD|nr:hypothetical protein [Tianweitania sp.]